MTNNFEEFKKYIQKTYQVSGISFFGTSFNKDDDTFFSIEIIRRGKDNPNMPAANYLFKSYHINTIEDLDKYKQEIIDLCNLFKVRAYISVNRKSYRKCLWRQNELIAKRICDSDYRKPYKLWQKAVSSYHHQQDKRWIIDIDENDEEYLQFIRNVINSTQAGNNRIIQEFKTKNGYHFITLSFDVTKYSLDICDKYGVDRIPEIKKNALTLLYENIV